jgi:hypothetical protein
MEFEPTRYVSERFFDILLLKADIQPICDFKFVIIHLDKEKHFIPDLINIHIHITVIKKIDDADLNFGDSESNQFYIINSEIRIYFQTNNKSHPSWHLFWLHPARLQGTT